ncbi:MAG: four helix bundle protein [Muribaculaceae bacterium]|nr:four helix bundle protein [Muribaculaceae bacterium]
MNKSDYKELKIWQKGMILVEEVYKLIRILPPEEKFGLCDQMRRCSVSIPSNIAEGHKRNSDKEFLHFLSISKGSLGELETQLLLCQRLGYADERYVSELCSKVIEVDKMIAGLMTRISKL